MPYQTVAARWHDFYVVSGTASATLVGLLFVGLSLHLAVVLSHGEVRGLARVTFANFALLLFVSMFMVIPQTATAASAEIFVSGLVTLAVTAPSLVAAVTSRTRTLRPARLVLRIGLSTVAYVAVIVAGTQLREPPYTRALDWMVAVTVLLLFISLRSVWDLLVSVGDAGGD